MNFIIPLQDSLLILGLSVTRMTAACLIVPFMAKQLVSSQVRNAIVLSWGMIVFPMVAPTVQPMELSTAETVVLITKEVVLGLMIGAMAAKLFWIAMSVGFFIDNQRGASMASVFDPTAGEQTSPIGQLLQQAMMALFYASGGMLVFLAAMFESYQIWPIGSFSPEFDESFALFFLDVFDELMQTIVVLAAPAIIAMFLATFGLGLVNRFAPQLNVFFLAMPVKSMIAMIVLILYLGFLFQFFGEELTGIRDLFAFFRNAAP